MQTTREENVTVDKSSLNYKQSVDQEKYKEDVVEVRNSKIFFYTLWRLNEAILGTTKSSKICNFY